MNMQARMRMGEIGDWDAREMADERVQQVSGKWYYRTRDGRTVGPFETRRQARIALDGYDMICRSPLFDQEALARIDSLSLD